MKIQSSQKIMGKKKNLSCPLLEKMLRSKVKLGVVFNILCLKIDKLQYAFFGRFNMAFYQGYIDI